MTEALIDMHAMRRFAEIKLISDEIPNERTMLALRHSLE